jgi:hypothetical protein
MAVSVGVAGGVPKQGRLPFVAAAWLAEGQSMKWWAGHLVAVVYRGRLAGRGRRRPHPFCEASVSAIFER